MDDVPQKQKWWMNMPTVIMVCGVLGVGEGICELITGHTLPSKRGPDRYVGTLEPYISLIVGAVLCYVSFSWKRYLRKANKACSPNQSTDPTLASVTPPAGQESRPR